MELASYNGDASVGILVDNELWLRMNVQCATNCYDHGWCGCCNNHISSKNSARFYYEPCRSNDWYSPLAVVCSSFLHFGEHKVCESGSFLASQPNTSDELVDVASLSVDTIWESESSSAFVFGNIFGSRWTFTTWGFEQHWLHPFFLLTGLYKLFLYFLKGKMYHD